MRPLILPTLLLVAAAPAMAQPRTPAPMTQAFSWVTGGDPDRAILGISTQSDGKRDTLGLLIVSVTTGGPADKAGIEEGNRIASVNGVSLKLSRADAGEDDMNGVMTNRLAREMRKLKAGDEASLEIWAGGRYRTVRVKTIAADELTPRRATTTRSDWEDQAVIGVSLSTTGSRRDTLGVFVSAVTEDGPAEKAGIAEGDRIASVNGVDLRTPKEDIGEWAIANSRIQRLQREIRKLKAGDGAELVVVSGGRSRTVRVTTVRAADLKTDKGGFSFRYGDGPSLMFSKPGAFALPRIQVNPKVRVFKDEIDTHRAMDEVHRSLEMIGPSIRRELDRELPKAMEEVRKSLDRIRIEAPLLRAKLTRSVVI